MPAKLKIREIRGEYDKAGAMHELLAPAAFVDDQTVLTKRRDLFTILRVAGLDAECMAPELIESAARRLESSLRNLGGEYRVYQYLMKRKGPALPFTGEGDRAGERRAEWMAARSGDLYSIELYFAILRIAPVEKKMLGFLSDLSVRRTLVVSQNEIARNAEALATVVGSLVIQLRDTVKPAVLGGAETLRFLRRLVNYTPYKSDTVSPVHTSHLDQQMACSGLECWPRHLRQDDFFIRMLSLTEPPAKTFANILRAMLAVPCSFILCSEWKRQDNALVRKFIDGRRRHHHFGKTSMMSYIGGGKDTKEHEILVDDSKTAIVDELNNALKEMEVQENHFGRYSLTLALYGQDDAELRRSVARATEVFSTHDAKLLEETYNMRNAWLSMVPGNYAFSLRQMWLLNTNYADMSFLFSPSTGEPINAHLGKSCLAVVDTNEASPFALNLHYQDTGHTAILGAIGSGKSFLVNFLACGYQQYQPYTVIFDLGGSYQGLTHEYQGSYSHVGKATRGFTINPFSLAPTEENLKFLFSFVRVLVEAGGYEMTAEDKKDLHRNLLDLYALDAAVRRLGSLGRTCKRSYSRYLEEWIGDGRLASYFDNEHDTLSIARFQTFDFEGMDQHEILEPLLFYVLHRANVSIYDRDQHFVPKLFVFDEAWRFFRNPTTREYITEALKTWRKRNAVMILATQSSDDLMRDAMLAVVSESCFTKCFLANPGMDAAVYRDLFHLNSTETALIAGLIPKQQFLLKRPGFAKVLNLHVDDEMKRVFTNVS